MLTQQEYFALVNQKYDRRFDYRETEYINLSARITFRCKVHDCMITISAKSHRDDPHGNGGCTKCRLEKNGAECFRRCREVHGEQYNYVESSYTGADKKITIICPEHGSFTMRAGAHQLGSGCKECAKVSRKMKRGAIKTQEDFLRLAGEKHGDFYDYSKTVFKKTSCPVTIICRIHGEFEIKPADHVGREKARGCSKCGSRPGYMTKKEFIKLANDTHDGRYDYSKVKKIPDPADAKKTGRPQTVRIKCKKCKKFFEQTAFKHVYQKKGCPKCATKKHTRKSIIAEFHAIHGQMFDYSDFKFTNMKKSSAIVCQAHGKFEASPKQHLVPGSGGCPGCSGTQFDENMAKWLKKKGYDYLQQNTWKNCQDKTPLPFGFWLPNEKVIIEIDEPHYFKANDKIGGEEGLVLRQSHVVKKTRWAVSTEKRVLRIDHETMAGTKKVWQDLVKKFIKSDRACKLSEPEMYGWMRQEIDLTYRRIVKTTPEVIKGVVKSKVLITDENSDVDLVSENQEKLRTKAEKAFLKKARVKYGDAYVYDDMDFKNSKTEITYRCKEHGTVCKQKPKHHLKAAKCRQCKKKSKQSRVVSYRPR